MMTDDSATDVSKYGSVELIGSSDIKEDQSSDQFDFESVGEGTATENEGDSEDANSPNHPVVKVKTLVEYHLEFLTKHPGEVFFYGCRLCAGRFTSRNSFLIHMKLHDVRKRYPCPHCAKAYDRKFQLVHHLRLHTEETPHECGVCFVAYAHEAELLQHSRVHRSDKPFECRFCLKGFPQKKALIVHLRMHTGERPFPCQFCDRTFTQKAHLQGHMVRIHIPKNKVDYQRGGEMQPAMQTTPADNKSVLSLLAYSQNNSTSQHLTHLNHLTPHRNTSSPLGMPAQMDLSILSGQREKLIECDFCDKKFTYERNKTNHMKKHGYGGEVAPAHFDCGVCRRTFASRGLLVAHALTHAQNHTQNMHQTVGMSLNNTSPFRCDICGREFNMKRNLIMHVKSHNNERPFECPACEKSFKLKYFLELHVTRIHPHVRLEDLHKKKEVSVSPPPTEKEVGDARGVPVTPNKRKQSQPKKVIMRSDYETDSDSSCGDYSSDSAHEMEVTEADAGAHRMEVDTSEPFDAAKFVQAFVRQPKTLIARKDDRGIAKSMQINLPHDLQHVKSLLNSKAPLAPPAGATRPVSCSPSISCPLCSAVVSNHSALALHMKEHEKNKPHQCTMCEKVYIQQASFEKHLKKHMLDEIVARQTKMIEQATSKMKFPGQNGPENIIETPTKPEGRKPLECNICKKKYAQPASFEKHMRQHSELGETTSKERMSYDGFDKKSKSTGDSSDVPGEGMFINPSDFLEVSIEH